MFTRLISGRGLWIAALALLQLSCDTPETKNRPNPAPPPATTRSAAEKQSLEKRLMGTWIAKDVDAKLGEVMVKLTFRQEGPMKLAAWSDIPFVGQVRDKTAPYEVHGNVISSQAIRGGTSVEFWFDAGDLIIKYKEGKTVRFKRQ